MAVYTEILFHFGNLYRCPHSDAYSIGFLGDNKPPYKLPCHHISYNYLYKKPLTQAPTQHHSLLYTTDTHVQRQREGEREGGREGRREGGREEGRERGREGGRKNVDSPMFIAQPLSIANFPACRYTNTCTHVTFAFYLDINCFSLLHYCPYSLVD